MLIILFIAVAMAPIALASAEIDLKVEAVDSLNSDMLRLSWTVQDPSGLCKYRVLRSTSEGEGFVLVATNDLQMDHGGLMDHYDSGLDTGTTYYYMVELLGENDAVLSSTRVAGGTTPGGLWSGGKKTVVPGKSIFISVAEQRAYFVEGYTVVKSHLVSTGTTSHPTPIGNFRVLFHSQCVVSVKYGGAYCYWWLGFADDIGMHALPYNPGSGTYSGGHLLGSRASHGCVRQAVADAQWAYNWAPNGIPVTVSNSRFVPPVPPVPDPSGGHAGQGITGTSNTWYFAEGCTTGRFHEYIALSNPGDDAATVNATFMKPDGTTTTTSCPVAPKARSTIHVNDIPGLENTEVSASLVSDQPIVAERIMTFQDFNDKDGGTCSAGVTAPVRSWYFAEGYTGGSFDEYILIQNPGPTDAQVSISFMKNDGATVVRDYTVGGNSRFSLHADGIPGLEHTDVSAVVNSDVPVVAERAMYFNYNGKKDGNASTGITSTSKGWYLAEGYTGGDFDTYVLVLNPGDNPTDLVATFMRPDGSSVSKNYTLAARSRMSIRVNDIPGLEMMEFSTMVEATEDVVVERAMYFDTEERLGGADAPGVAEPSGSWFFAEGYTGGDYDSYLLMMNPSPASTVAHLALYKADGTQYYRSFVLQGNSRFTVHVDEVPGFSATEFSAEIRSLDPIVCERAEYFSFPREK